MVHFLQLVRHLEELFWTKGEFIAGFASSYDHIDIVATELAALIDGIQLARDLGITSYTVEVDSSIVFNMVRRHGIIHWRHIYLLRHIWGLLEPNAHIKLIVREQNMVADALAKEAQNLQSRFEFFTLQDLSRNVQKLVFIDRIGLPVFRATCK